MVISEQLVKVEKNYFISTSTSLRPPYSEFRASSNLGPKPLSYEEHFQFIKERNAYFSPPPIEKIDYLSVDSFQILNQIVKILNHPTMKWHFHQTPDTAEEFLQQLQAKPSIELFASLEHGKVLSTCTIQEIDDERVSLGLLASNPFIRYEGAGEDMLCFAILHSFKDKKSKQIGLSFSQTPDWEASYSWYIYYGFETVGEREKFKDLGIVDILEGNAVERIGYAPFDPNLLIHYEEQEWPLYAGELFYENGKQFTALHIVMPHCKVIDMTLTKEKFDTLFPKLVE